MALRPRECLVRFHLLILASLVALSLTIVLIGASIPSWCIREGDAFECHSLLHSDRAFSCLFKLLPAGIILCLILSLFMFVILAIGQFYVEYSGVAKKEYQFVARLVNILALSLAIVLIIVVLLQWFHPPSQSTREVVWAAVPDKMNSNDSSLNLENAVLVPVPQTNPSYWRLFGLIRRLKPTHKHIKNHGPNLFFAAFIILFVALLGFVIGHLATI